jgi:glycosyltransferase involved in cell wall biosynthesis
VSLEYLPPHLSGSGVYAEQVVRALRKNFEVRVVTACSGGVLPEHVTPVSLSRKRGTGGEGFEFALRALRVLDDLADYNPDLVLAVDWYGAAAALALSRRAGCPLLWMPFRIFSHSSSSLVVRELEKLLAREAKAILALSEVDAALIKKLFNREAAVLNPPLTLKGRGASQRENFILTVSRVSREKNIEALIKALPKITRELSLVVAGAVSDEEYMVKLKALARKLGVKGRVTFLGRVSQRRLVELYSRAMVYVSPTKYEPFGLSIVEAAYHRLPIVMDSSGLVGAGALFTHGKNCIKVNIGNEDALALAVNELFRSPEKARALGKEARKAAEKLTIEAFEERINSFILGMVNR